MAKSHAQSSVVFFSAGRYSTICEYQFATSFKSKPRANICIFKHELWHHAVDLLGWNFSSGSFQQIQDLIPFFLCMEGDFASALTSLFPTVNAPASRFTPQLFLFYFRVFKTATAPQVTVSQPEQLCCSDATWEPVKGQANCTLLCNSIHLTKKPPFDISDCPLCRCCPTEACRAGEVCAQGTEKLFCRLHWCKSTAPVPLRFSLEKSEGNTDLLMLLWQRKGILQLQYQVCFF